MTMIPNCTGFSLCILILSCLVSSTQGLPGIPRNRKTNQYEVWAADQSNSAANQTSLGVKGSYLWIFDSSSIRKQIATDTQAKPLPCYPSQTQGPCDLLELFPQNLQQYNDTGSPTGALLSDLEGFGRLHGVIKDPQGLYVVANIFAPAGGYVGIINTRTKEAIALFRVTQFSFKSSSGRSVGRSVHMSFWNEKDGNSILIDNLNGKAIEKIIVERDPKTQEITGLTFDKGSSLGLGREMAVEDAATFFVGKNAFGRDLIGSVGGAYDASKLGDLTPNNACKENGCAAGTDGALGGRPNNLPICPITSSNENLYVTMAGGGMLVVDVRNMEILAEYGNQIVYGAGCGGVETRGDKMFMNSGISASGAGNTQSMFGVWEFPDNEFRTGLPENTPAPKVVFEDPNNTNTGGNTKGSSSVNDSGQLPGVTTRRDSHGMDVTLDNRYLHVVDRLQNNLEVFNVKTHKRFSYDLTSKNGQGKGLGACAKASVPDVPINDPAPDLMERSPDDKFLMIAFRGPAPVSVPHSAQGSCPGVGVVQLLGNGRGGKLVTVLRTTNTVPDQFAEVTLLNGVDGNGDVKTLTYSGPERSDVHGAIVIPIFSTPKCPRKGQPCSRRKRCCSGLKCRFDYNRGKRVCFGKKKCAKKGRSCNRRKRCCNGMRCRRSHGYGKICVRY